MDRELSIVLSPNNKDYRKVAQVHWGLTDEQMKGMHVHHFPPQGEGGRNIPEHLYVCSDYMHYVGWHKANIGCILWASAGGKITGSTNVASGRGFCAPGVASAGGKRGGKRAFELGVGCHAPEVRGKGGRNTARQTWESTVDGFQGNAGNVAKHNRANGWDPNARKRV
jgi:hypothetical protein